MKKKSGKEDEESRTDNGHTKGDCYVCAAKATVFCTRCGAYVCDTHYEEDIGVCVNCG